MQGGYVHKVVQLQYVYVGLFYLSNVSMYIASTFTKPV